MSKKKKVIKKHKGTQAIIKKLSRGVIPETRSVVEAVVSRFLPHYNHFHGQEAPGVTYTDLSSPQKKALHKEIQKSMIDRSSTASGKSEKSGRLDRYPQSSVKAKKQLKKAYRFMKQSAEAKVPLSIEMLEQLSRITVPQIPKESSGVRTGFHGKKYSGFVRGEDVKPLLSNLIEFINNPPTDLDWVIVENIAQGIFLSIHPFMEGNGRVNRMMLTYMKILHGKIPAPFAASEQETRHLIHAQVSPEALQKEMAQAILDFKALPSTELCPFNLSPKCFQRLKKAAGLPEKTWKFQGRDITHDEMLKIEAEMIIQAAKNNTKLSLEIIEKNNQAVDDKLLEICYSSQFTKIDNDRHGQCMEDKQAKSITESLFSRKLFMESLPDPIEQSQTNGVERVEPYNFMILLPFLVLGHMTYHWLTSKKEPEVVIRKYHPQHAKKIREINNELTAMKKQLTQLKLDDSQLKELQFLLTDQQDMLDEIASSKTAGQLTLNELAENVRALKLAFCEETSPYKETPSTGNIPLSSVSPMTVCFRGKPDKTHNPNIESNLIDATIKW